MFMSGFDPRFDPAFQPGFSASTSALSSAPSVAVPKPAPHSSPVDASPQANPLPPLLVVPPASTATTPRLPVATLPANAPADAQTDVPAHAPADFVAGARSVPPAPSAQLSFLHRTNRFVLALWAASILFVVGGFGVLRLLGDHLTALANGGVGNSTDFYFLEAYAIGANLLIILGLATATATLFLFAARGSKT